jgi:hypothetical protein
LNILRSDVGEKISWNGVLISIQPRIRLNRSFDQVSHVYLGYSLRVQGIVGGEVREFLVGIGAGAQAQHQLQAGDAVSGDALPVADPRLETIEFYKVSNLKVTERTSGTGMQPPPMARRSSNSPCLPGTWSSAARCTKIPNQMYDLCLGMPHGG